MMYTKGEWKLHVPDRPFLDFVKECCNQSDKNLDSFVITNNAKEKSEYRILALIGHGPKAEANAQRIVQCVNGFDELVGSLDELVWLNKQMTVTDGVRGDIQQRIITRAKLALKNAGGNNA